MARGNQRENAREAAAKKAGNTVCDPRISGWSNTTDFSSQKNKTTMSGSEQMRNKDEVARIMREKQLAAEEKKKAEAAAGGKK
ncbi:hypothetical protein LTR95_018382 [Oleoguttula sp. CCFEE 5521]